MTKHADDCDWHVDQYPWECTCGAIKPVEVGRDDKYIHYVVPLAWCSQCGPGECEHSVERNDALFNSFKEPSDADPIP